MADGQFVYAWSRVWSDQEAEVPFSLSCFSPAKVYVNRSLVYESNLNDDVFPDRNAYFRTKLSRGWNHLVLEFVRTGTGCGGNSERVASRASRCTCSRPPRTGKGRRDGCTALPNPHPYSLFPEERMGKR
ncbi:hypothetical protein N6H14_31805 [Paenibacillus sp. CC-CFT747]|nr:hypothetical protein N6H14_31805 [Paenibacillus sp. CC-CFT747]